MASNLIDAANNSLTNTTSGKIIPSSSNQFMDNLAFVDHFGQAIVGQLKSQVSINFGYGLLDEQFDIATPETENGGTISVDDGYLVAATTSSGDRARLSSRNFIRYSNGRGFFVSFTASFEGEGTGKAGAWDDNDGFAIFVDKTVIPHTYEFAYIQNGVKTGAVPIDTSKLDMDKINIFHILGGFLGVANPTLFARKDSWIPIATIKTEGRMNSTHVRIPAFPVSVEASDGLTIRSGSWHAGTVGEAERVQDRGFSLPNSPFSSAGGANPVTAPQGKVTIPANGVRTLVTIRSKDLFNGLPNKIGADIINYRITVFPSSGTDGVVQVQLIGNPTIAGSSFVDVSPSSVLQFDSYNAGNGGGAAGQFDITSPTGDVIGFPLDIPYSGGLGNTGNQESFGAAQVDQFDLDGLAGETLAFLCRNVGADPVVVYWSITWIERQV